MIALSDAQGVAWIGGLFTVVSLVIGALMKVAIERATSRVTLQNTDEHEINKTVLLRVESKLDDLGSAFTDHLSWHVDNPPTTTKKDAAA